MGLFHTQAQAAFVTASVKEFALSTTIEGADKDISGRLGAIRVRDKTKEAVFWREVIETAGDEVWLFRSMDILGHALW